MAPREDKAKSLRHTSAECGEKILAWRGNIRDFRWLVNAGIRIGISHIVTMIHDSYVQEDTQMDQRRSLSKATRPCGQLLRALRYMKRRRQSRTGFSVSLFQLTGLWLANRRSVSFLTTA